MCAGVGVSGLGWVGMRVLMNGEDGDDWKRTPVILLPEASQTRSTIFMPQSTFEKKTVLM